MSDLPDVKVFRDTLRSGGQGPEAQTVQPSLFDEHNLAEIYSDEFPGERLVACFILCWPTSVAIGVKPC